MKATYRVFRTSASTGETTILAKFSDTAAYLHSFFMTADHVVLCLWNSHLSKAGLSILMNLNILDSIAAMDPSLPARWYVIDRKHGKGVLATYESPAFFCFHTVNAWTEPSTSDPSATDICCTLSAFENTDVLKKFYYENIVSSSSVDNGYIGEKGDTSRPELRQYRLHAVPSTKTSSPPVGRLSLDFSAPKPISVELPTINPRFITKPNRYTYGIVDRSKSTFVDGLGKFDAQTKTTIFWERHGHSPGEAIFVPNPEAEGEDDGVLLSVVLDGIKGNSYLLCLDAKDMTELGKADVPGVVGFGFHGTFWNGKSLEL
jgi:torulene dioxygenase